VSSIVISRQQSIGHWLQPTRSVASADTLRPFKCLSRDLFTASKPPNSQLGTAAGQCGSMAGLRKLLLLILPVLVALAAHYHRQGSLVLPPQLAGPAEELWQQLRVHLPFQVPVADLLRRDSSAAQQAAGGSSAPAQVGVCAGLNCLNLLAKHCLSKHEAMHGSCLGRQAVPSLQPPSAVLPRRHRRRRYRWWQTLLTLASAGYPERWMT
jgi:hypothetical protein